MIARSLNNHLQPTGRGGASALPDLDEPRPADVAHVVRSLATSPVKMALILAAFAAVLTACSDVGTLATLDAATATLTLGVGEHYSLSTDDLPPPLDRIEGFMFPAQLTNTTSERLWYYAESGSESPVAQSWACPPGSDNWSAVSFNQCGNGDTFQELAADKSVTFKVCAPNEFSGGRLRVAVVLFDAPSEFSPAGCVSSPVVAIP